MDTLPARPVLRVRCTADLLALVPVTLGFEPEESLVVIATAGPHPGFQARVDLPGTDDADPVADQLVRAVLRQGCTRVAVVAFSRRAGWAERAVRTTGDRLGVAGIELLDLLRTDGSRYWSLLCDDASCCPPSGTPYDARTTALRAEAVAAGRTVVPDRAALAARYGGPTGPERATSTAAVRAAEADVVKILGLRGPRQLRRPSARTIRAAAPLGATTVEEILDDVLGGPGGGDRADPHRVGEAVTDGLAATLAVWCSLIPVRDFAWARMTRVDAEAHLSLWTAVARRVVPPYEPAVLGLTAFAAWLSGDGASAWCVLDRCAAVDPRYSMAALVADALHRCISPDGWEPVPRDVVLEACGLVSPPADPG